VRATQHGRVTGSAVAVVGVWDPFLHSHKSLLEDLRDGAVERGCSSVAVLIDPHPGSFSGFRARYGTPGWPVYDSVPARIRLMRDIGLDSVLCMRFRKHDFDSTAAQFLDAVRARVEFEELWLGALQLLGPGTQGARAAVADYADRRGFRLTVLPRPPVGTYDVRALLASGRLTDAIDLVGRPPIWSRPPSGTLRLSWRPGRYRAVGLEKPGAIAEGVELEVTLKAQPSGPSKLIWPRRDTRYLAFTSGPADVEPGKATDGKLGL
jgi:FAD synthase